MPENYTIYWDEIEINREFLIKILDQICEKYDLTNEENFALLILQSHLQDLIDAEDKQ